MGATATATDIQAKIDKAHSEAPAGGFGRIIGPSDSVVELDEPLTLKSNVFLENFRFKIADRANVTAIRTEGFSSLTGTGAWFVETEDVPYNFGLIDVHIDGNKQNNSGTSETSVDGRAIGGLAFFGKQYVLGGKVMVRNCVGDGFYSEAGKTVGQKDWRDTPESSIEELFVRNCSGGGITYRGPHDGHATKVISYHNDGRGFALDESDRYSGAGFLMGRFHGYTNGGVTKIGAIMEGWHFRAAGAPELRVTDAATIFYLSASPFTPVIISDAANIGMLRASGRDADVEAAITISGNYAFINRVLVRRYDGNGIVVTGNRTTINSARVIDNSGIGILNRGSHTYIGDVHVVNNGDDGLVFEGWSGSAGNVQIGQNSGDGIVVDAKHVTVGDGYSSKNDGYGCWIGVNDGVFNCDISLSTVNKNGDGGLRYDGGSQNAVNISSWIGPEFVGYVLDGELPGPHDDFTIRFDGPGEGVGQTAICSSETIDFEHTGQTYRVNFPGKGLIAPPEQLFVVPKSLLSSGAFAVSNQTSDGFEIRFRKDLEIPIEVDQTISLDYIASVGGMV